MTSAPAETWHFPLSAVGHEVRVFDELASTNDTAMECGRDGANPGVVILRGTRRPGADSTAASGSPAPVRRCCSRSSCRRRRKALRPAVLTAWAAVGVAETIHDMCGCEAAIKWPNDVLVGGKKACGILIEQSRGTVAGIGLNVNQTAEEFRDAGLPDATSLRMLAGVEHDPHRVLAALLSRLNRTFKQLLAGDVTALQAAWVERLGLLGKAVVAELTDGRAVRGTLTDATFEAVAITDTGREPTLHLPESVRQLRPA